MSVNGLVTCKKYTLRLEKRREKNSQNNPGELRSFGLVDGRDKVEQEEASEVIEEIVAEIPYLSLGEGEEETTEEGEGSAKKKKEGKWDKEATRWNTKTPQSDGHWSCSGAEKGPRNIPESVSPEGVFDLLWPWEFWKMLAIGTRGSSPYNKPKNRFP